MVVTEIEREARPSGGPGEATDRCCIRGES